MHKGVALLSKTFTKVTSYSYRAEKTNRAKEECL